jgi:Recombination enhancement, RecA-dependent nuclease
MTKDEKKHLGKVAALGCVLCHLQGIQDSPSEIHHPRKGTGMAQRASHYDAIPLCPEHHRGKTGIHGMGVKAFTKHYDIDEAGLLHITRRLVAHQEHLADGWKVK